MVSTERMEKVGGLRTHLEAVNRRGKRVRMNVQRVLRGQFSGESIKL